MSRERATDLRRVAPLCALGSLLLAACSRPATQLVVRVDSNLDAEDRVCVHVAVRPLDPEQVPIERVFPLAVGAAPALELPFSFGVTAPGGSAQRRVALTVSAMAAGAGCREETLLEADVTVVQRVRTGFLPEQTLLVPIYLDRRCERVTCGDSSNCEAGMCVPVQETAPGMLTVIRPGTELEVGLPDAGPEDDAGPDAGPDAPVADVGPDAVTGDAGLDASRPPIPTEEATLSAIDGMTGDRFGDSVALSADGTRAIIGATNDVTPRGATGSATVYVRTGGVWIVEQVLLAGDGEDGDRFGASVALSADGSRALVGAYQDPTVVSGEPGSVRVFLRTGAAWSEEATLVAPDGAGSLGIAVSISADGTRALAGASTDRVGTSSSVGSARVFLRTGTIWTHEANLPGLGAQFDYYGSAVSLSADGLRALVGGPQTDTRGANSNAGDARVFVRSGTTWTLEARLSPSGPTGLAEGDYFGESVALSSDGSRAMIGAHGMTDPVAGVWAGGARAFVRTGTTWTEEATLRAVDPRFNERLGASVALTADGSTALFGAPTTSPGRALLFRRSGTMWTQAAELVPSMPGTGNFGADLSLSADGSSALIGAPSPGTGNASVFALP